MLCCTECNFRRQTPGLLREIPHLIVCDVEGEIARKDFVQQIATKGPDPRRSELWRRRVFRTSVSTSFGHTKVHILDMRHLAR
jgi:hypothetical protein